ncbi:MAG: S1 RNA-binding domain-containing protein [Actinobacteria bacterium]|nr:S1 RNA-binding domain-containing protein [Actinomycetota bacterium]
MSDNATPEAPETEADPETAAGATDAAAEATETEAATEAPAAEAPAASEAPAAPATPAGPYPPLTPGDRVTGEVVKLVEFGAFVDVLTEEGTVTGLVHVSEVDRGFVENIYAHLSVGEEVTVKVVSVGDDGKIGLSIKQADPEWEDEPDLDRPRRSTIDKDFDRRLRKFMHGSQSIQGEVRRQKRGRLGND